MWVLKICQFSVIAHMIWIISCETCHMSHMNGLIMSFEINYFIKREFTLLIIFRKRGPGRWWGDCYENWHWMKQNLVTRQPLSILLLWIIFVLLWNISYKIDVFTLRECSFKSAWPNHMAHINHGPYWMRVWRGLSQFKISGVEFNIEPMIGQRYRKK